MKRSRARSALSMRRLRQQAADLAAGVPVEQLRATALAAIRARPRTEPVAIACSGGADSVALLLFLWAYLPERRGRWLVLHFDHRLREPDSTVDAKFVRHLARQLGERCMVGRWSRPTSTVRVKVSEADARDARWAFFRGAMRQAGARVIALGHQLDDVAETMLMRLVRGSGGGALAAPRPVQAMGDGTQRVRPLLDMPAKVLRLLLAHFLVPWREDATNAQDDFFRNRVRRHVLPALVRAAGRDPGRGLGDARDLLEEDDEALTTWLGEIVAAPSDDRAYDVSALRGRPGALARRAVHRWFRAVGLVEPPGRGDVDELVSAVASGVACCFSAGRDRFVDLAEGRLRLVGAGDAALRGQRWISARLNPGESLTGPRGDRLALTRVRLTPRLRARIRAGDFPHDRMAYLDPGAGWPGWLHVREWWPGDRYRPLGAPGRAKLQDLFTNRRVPRELRPLVPVVLNSAGKVIWVPGLPLAEEVAVQPASKLVVQLTYTPVPPMVHRSIAHTSTDVRHRKA